MNCMDMTNKSTKLDLSEVNYDTKKYLYSMYFSSNTNTNDSFSDKIELISLLCFLTQTLCKLKPNIFKNTLDVIKNYIYAGETFGAEGSITYMEGISIICDDYLYGVNPIEKPANFTNTVEIRSRIKELLSNWIPF